MLWFFLFIFAFVYRAYNEISTEVWKVFWHMYIWITFGVALITTIWISIGGVIDIKKMFQRLETLVRDDNDDGTVNKED